MKPKNKLPPWLRPKTSNASLAVAVGWYTEDEWAKVRMNSADVERFEATYAEWIQVAEEALKELRARGIMAQKYYIQANELLAWCLAQNKTNNGAARAEFVSQRASKASSDGA